MNRLRLFLFSLLALVTATASQAVVNGECEFVQGSITTNQGFVNCDEEIRVRSRTIDTIAAVRLLTTALAPETHIYVTEWSTGTGLGGGVFYRSGTGGTDNGGTLIVDASGRNWNRLSVDPITPEMFSADDDPLTNDTTALQATIDHLETVGGRLHLAHHYLSTSTLAYVSDLPITVAGDGADNSGLIFDVGAGVDGLTFTFSAWNTSGIPELRDFALLTKKPATVAGTALKIIYTTLPASGSRKGIVVENLKIYTGASPSTEYWTNGVELSRTPHSFISNNWIQGQSSLTSTKTGFGIKCGTWCNGTRIHDNKIRGWLDGFLVQSVFESPTTFQFEGVSFSNNTISNNDIGINVDLWDTETAIRIVSNALDNSVANIRIKNLVNSTISNNSMFWNGQVKAHTDVLLITTANDAGGAPVSSGGTHIVLANIMTRASLNNAITGITQANPAVVTYTGNDNWVNGGKIFLTDVLGMTQVNDLAFTVANLNAGANTFELRNEADTANIDSTAYGAYTSGGIVEALSIGIDVQGGNSNVISENNAVQRNIGIRLGSLVDSVSVNRNRLSTDVQILNNMSTAPQARLVGRQTDANVLEELNVGTGLVLTSGALDWDATELSNLTWGSAGGGFAWTFNAGATDAVITFGAGGSVILGTNDGANPTSFVIDDEGTIDFREEAAGGTNIIRLKAPATIGTSRTCTFVDAAAPIPDSCVGDGTDDVGGGGVSDGDKGDIVVSGVGTVWDVDVNSVALTTDTTGNYAAGDGEAGAALTGDSATNFFSTGAFDDAQVDGSLEINEVITAALGGVGIDVAAQVADIDATELSALTWGAAGGGFAWTFNAGATDVVLTYGAGGSLVLGTNDGANPTSLVIDDEGTIDFREEAAGGTNVIRLKAPATIGTSRTCTFQDTANPIPDSCVGDGTDAGGSTPFTRIAGASGAAGADVTLQRLTANCTANATTTAAVCMTTTGVGAGVWNFKYVVRYQSSVTTTGVSFSVNHTGTTGAFLSDWKFVSTGAAAATGVADQVAAVNIGQMVEGKSERVKNTISTASAGVDTINVDMLVILEGMIVVTVSGDLQFKHASETANSTQVMDDTHLILTKIE